jgi:hypothetical protein
MNKSLQLVCKLLCIASALALTCLFLVGAKSWSSHRILTQDNGIAHGKVIEKENFPNTPFEVIDLKATNKLVKFGEKFDDDENWLKKINFKLKNNSDKPIVYVLVYLHFPETEATGMGMTFQLQYGQRPGAKTVTGKPILLIKGEVSGITLSDSDYGELKRFIESRQSLGSISKVVINIPTVYFADGTVWSGGVLYRPDATAPGGMRAVSNK